MNDKCFVIVRVYVYHIQMIKMVWIENFFFKHELYCHIYLEISIIKETLTSDSTISLNFNEIVKKDKNHLGHIMISYNHSTKAICSKISKYLKVNKINHFQCIFINCWLFRIEIISFGLIKIIYPVIFSHLWHQLWKIHLLF